jgi:SAM-dependent methyltransferase
LTNNSDEFPSDGRYLAGLGDIRRRMLNTFFCPKWLFDLIISDHRIDEMLNLRMRRDPVYFVERILQRLFWFWPRIIDAKYWSEGDSGKLYTPDNYREIDGSSAVLCDAVERYASGRDAPILDVGCNIGRHVAALARRGFTQLSGVDAMGAALQRMRDTFPETQDVVIYHDLFQRFLRNQPDRAYDLIYTHGATIEMVHPSFDVVGNMCRLARHHIVLIHNEFSRTVYPRFWHYEFARHGFFLCDAKRPIGHAGGEEVWERNSLLVFRRYR